MKHLISRILVLPIYGAMIRSLGILFTIGLGFSSLAVSQTTPRTVMVHLFEWPWGDIATECENVLGPAGVAAVQVSPPQEHAVFDFAPWWQRYQPVSYKLVSRSGDRAQFVDMVKRCNQSGVSIYVDAVLNHMSFRNSGVGSAGSPFKKYQYPALYSDWDFHSCRHGIDNGGDRWQVHNCDLATAPDLATESDYVRTQLAGYINDLISIGVKGLRLDGAKHIPAQDLTAIFEKVHGSPYIFQEVIDFGNDVVPAKEYFGIGDVTEFRYSAAIANTFRQGKLSWLSNFGTAWGFMAGYYAVVFVDNHDNQRGHGAPGNAINFKDGPLHELANIFMLAWPYGYPRLMSSYEFSDPDEGPPSVQGKTLSVLGKGGRCNNGWVCEHRKPGILRMIEFRNLTTGSNVTNWWDNGNDQIAFSREGRAFVAINREELNTMTVTLKTGLAPGIYCDIISGELLDQSCTGKEVLIDKDGLTEIQLEPMSAIAIHQKSTRSLSRE